MNTRTSNLHSLLVASPVPKLVVDDESNQPCPVVHENNQSWLSSHVLLVVEDCVVWVLAMIMTMTEQFSMNIHPEIFILDDLINASPSASINVCAVATT